MNFNLYANNNGNISFFNFFFNFFPRPMAKAVDVNDLAEFVAFALVFVSVVARADAVTEVDRDIAGTVTVGHTNAAVAIGWDCFVNKCAAVVEVAMGGLR